MDAAEYWEFVLTRCDLLDERNDGLYAWENTLDEMKITQMYPLNRDAVKGLIDKFETLREMDGKPLIVKEAIWSMIKLSQMDIGKEFDIIDTRFIELFCDIYFSSAYGPRHLHPFNADEVHAFLVSEKFILEEIRFLPGYENYVQHIKGLYEQETRNRDCRDKLLKVYNGLYSVRQCGRLTKRADPDS